MRSGLLTFLLVKARSRAREAAGSDLLNIRERAKNGCEVTALRNGEQPGSCHGTGTTFGFSVNFLNKILFIEPI